MLTKRFLVPFAAAIASVAAQNAGFNYASTNADGSPAMEADFENLFTTAQGLAGASGKFSSARLYTMIQSGTTNTPIEAIPAAIKTRTTMLLGLWASAGQEAFNNELAALASALSMYGPQMTDLVAGISVGSEDLYRDTAIGIANDAGTDAGSGTSPDVIANYIQQTRSVLRKASATNLKVGHVDTWTAWVNGSNSAAVAASDFLGLDAYPYYEKVSSNAISNGLHLFDLAYEKTLTVAAGKEVWITETGWPLAGDKSHLAIASPQNAKLYWDAVACKYLGQTNMWYFTLYDGTVSPSFGITGPTLSTQPAFNLKCPKHVAVHSPSPTHTHTPTHTTHTHTHTAKPSSSTTTHHTTTIVKTHHHKHTSVTKTSHTTQPTHKSKHHKHPKHHPSGKKTSAPHAAHHKQEVQPSPSNTPATGASNAKATDAPNGAGIAQPSALLLITMLAFWCL